MKTKVKFFVMAIILMAIVVVSGCQKHPPTPPPPAPVPATVTMGSYSDLSMSGVMVSFTVTPNDYPVNEAGLAYNTSDATAGATEVTAKTSSGTITLSLNNLNKNTKYYIWAYIKTEKGTTYSSKKLHVWTYGLMDIDGNGYHTVKIGSQTWTVENLRVTHYNNGDLIPEVQDSTKWLHDIQGARCYYDNNQSKYDSVYGALYNWYVIGDHRGIAPQGWHVPTGDEYNDLSIFLGKNNLAGGKMKEKGLKHWKTPNSGATNSSGWTALPGGLRGFTIKHKTVISFADLNGFGYWWTKSRGPAPTDAIWVTLDYNDTWMDFPYGNKNGAYSIRLIKN